MLLVTSHVCCRFRVTLVRARSSGQGTSNFLELHVCQCSVMTEVRDSSRMEAVNAMCIAMPQSSPTPSADRALLATV